MLSQCFASGDMPSMQDVLTALIFTADPSLEDRVFIRNYYTQINEDPNPGMTLSELAMFCAGYVNALNPKRGGSITAVEICPHCGGTVREIHG
jgi:hypothetical protein